MAKMSFAVYLQQNSSSTHRWVRHNDYEQALVNGRLSFMIGLTADTVAAELAAERQASSTA